MSNLRNNVQGAGCRATLLLLLLLATLPADALGQTAVDLAEDVRRLEHEVALARQEEDSARAKEGQQAIARFGRVQVGGLQLLTIPELRITVEAAGKIAWDVLSATYHDSIAVILRGFPISIVRQPPRDSNFGKIIYPHQSRLVFVPEEDPVRGLATALLAQITQELWLGQDEELRNWMKSPPPVTPDLSQAFSAAYLDLATSASPIGQRCLSDTGACREALGLGRPSEPAAAWYSPIGRRQLVTQMSHLFQVGESRQSYDRCVTGSDRDCLFLLRDVPELIPSPLLPPTRATFLRVAMEKGGPGSYPVLLASRGQPMEARFRQASGTDSDQLVQEWHRRVLAARPPPTTIRSGQALAAMGWTAVLLTLALRSSRWR